MSLSPRARTLAITGAVAALLAGCGLTPEDDAAAIERDILATPGAQAMWQTIQEEYPEDFDALVQQIRTLDIAERQNEEKVRQVGAQWLDAFFTRITPFAVKAPAGPLLSWSKAEHDLYATLQRGAVTECAAMAMGEWIFIDSANAAATSAITRRNIAIVRASKAGQADPQTYAEPDDAAFERYGQSIAATGLEPELQATLGSDAAMQALDPAQQCRLGVAVYGGLTNLPDDVEPAMAAYMLSPE